MTNDATRATAEAMALAPRGNPNLCIDMQALTEMSMYQLWTLHDCLHTIGDVVSGLMCQPRTADENDYTPAGKVLSHLSGWLSQYEDGVRNVALAAQPDTKKEAEWRAWMLLSFEAVCTDDLAAMSVLAAEMVRHVQTVAFHENHARRAS